MRNLSQPSKIPYHLALVFAPFDSRRRLTLGLSWKWKRESLEEIKERRIVEMSRDISRLIVWSQILGVERLSVYDRDGESTLLHSFLFIVGSKQIRYIEGSTFFTG